MYTPTWGDRVAVVISMLLTCLTYVLLLTQYIVRIPAVVLSGALIYILILIIIININNN